MPQFPNDPPPPEQRIDTLYVWIATHHDGAEGMMSADMDIGPPIGVRHIPLMTSKAHLAGLMESKARQLQRAALAETGRPITIELVEYRRVPK